MNITALDGQGRLTELKITGANDFNVDITLSNYGSPTASDSCRLARANVAALTGPPPCTRYETVFDDESARLGLAAPDGAADWAADPRHQN